MHCKPLGAQRSERARRAAKLPDQHAGLELRQSFTMASDHQQPNRDLIAKRNRQGVLQMRASRHRRIAVLRS